MAPLRSHKRHAGSSLFWLLPFSIPIVAAAVTGYAIYVVIILVRIFVARLVKLIVGHGRVQPMSRRDVEREPFRRELPVWQRPVHNLSRTTDELIWNPQGRSDSSVARAGDLPRLPLRVPDAVFFQLVNQLLPAMSIHQNVLYVPRGSLELATFQREE
jgi:hypothetical protein